MGKMTESRPEVHPRHSGEGGDDFGRILMELTSDFERFDWVIDDQRRMLEHSPGRFGHGHAGDGESLRFKIEAAELAVRTRKALDRLRRMAGPARSSLHPEPTRGLATEHPKG